MQWKGVILGFDSWSLHVIKVPVVLALRMESLLASLQMDWQRTMYAAAAALVGGQYNAKILLPQNLQQSV